MSCSFGLPGCVQTAGQSDSSGLTVHTVCRAVSEWDVVLFRLGQVTEPSDWWGCGSGGVAAGGVAVQHSQSAFDLVGLNNRILAASVNTAQVVRSIQVSNDRQTTRRWLCVFCVFCVLCVSCCHLERLNEAQHLERELPAGQKELLKTGIRKNGNIIERRTAGLRPHKHLVCRLCWVFFSPLVAEEFVRGDFPAHFAVELGAEERHSEAELQRDPLVFRRQG